MAGRRGRQTPSSDDWNWLAWRWLASLGQTAVGAGGGGGGHHAVGAVQAEWPSCPAAAVVLQTRQVGVGQALGAGQAVAGLNRHETSAAGGQIGAQAA